MKSVACTMIGYMSADLQRITFDYLTRWTDAPCTLVDNTERDASLTDLWNEILTTSDAEIHVLLNADACVTPGWFPPIRGAFDDPLVAVAGPSSNDGPQTIDLGQSRPDGLPPEDWLKDAGQRAREQHPGAVAEREIHGYCYAVRREAWVALGGFDPTIPFYGNETDFNKRAREAGWKVVKVYNSYVYHLGGYSVRAKRRRQ